MNQTPLCLFLVTLRVLLDDLDSTAQMYSDSALLNGLRSVVLMNRLPGYRLTCDRNNITPDLLAPTADPNNFAKVVLHTVRLFIQSRAERYEYKTRAMAERWGSYTKFLQNVEHELHEIENGPMFLGWQSYHAWVAGMAGLPVGLVLTNVVVRAPFFTASVSTAGVTIAPTYPSV